jgi:glycine betaine/proline transport system substrate-binding protein
MYKSIKKAAAMAVAATAVLGFGLFAGSPSYSQADKTHKVVKIGALGWEDMQAISLVTKKFLEKQGYKVDLTNFSEWGIAYSALANKDVDVMVSLPDFTTSDYWDRNHENLEKVSIASYGNYQTLAVPTYMKIDSIDQLNSVRDPVDGKIIGIEPGSGLMRLAAQAVKDYNLNYEIVEGSTAAMSAALQAALERKQPIVTMLWDTSWMMQKFDVKFLKDPKGVFPTSEGYYFLAPKGFSSENPALRANLAAVYLPTADISKMSSAIVSGKTAQQAVDDWWASHAKLTDRWSVQ